MNSTLAGILLYAVLTVVTYGVYRVVLDRLSDQDLGHADRHTLRILLVLGSILWPIIWVVQIFSIISTTIKAHFKSRES